jgi:hypothetical protein
MSLQRADLDRTCASSIYTTTYDQITVKFHCSAEVATLGLSFFVLGLAVGPMVLGPLSEVTLIFSTCHFSSLTI